MDKLISHAEAIDIETGYGLAMMADEERRAIRAAALEEAAKKMDRMGASADEDGDKVAACAFEEAAAAIRDLLKVKGGGQAMNWRQAVEDVKQRFGALGAGIEEIAVVARKEVWERMRPLCSRYNGDGECYSNRVVPGTFCAFDTCPLLKSVGGEEER